jgi:hypothetical protein
MDPDHVAATFPELAAIDDARLREQVTAAWSLAASDAGVTDLGTLPWLPPVQRDLGIEDESLVDHVRDVTACARALGAALSERRGATLDEDLLVACALVHDVSKLAEFDGHDRTAVGDLLGHPYYGVHLVARAGLPVECAHVVLSHTSRTTVEPAFLEAELVRRADEAAASAIRATAVEDLRNA